MKKLLPALLLVFVAGCATTTVGRSYFQPPAPAGGQSLVYLMRSVGGIGRGWATVFSIDGNEVVSLLDTGYTYVYLEPGVYTFSAGTRLDHQYLSIQAPIAAGSTYFIQYTQEPVRDSEVRNVLRVADPDVGQALIQNYFYKKAERPKGPAAPAQ